MGVWHEARAWEAECASNGINIGFGRGSATATMPKVSPTTSASGMICTCVRAVLGDDVERRLLSCAGRWKILLTVSKTQPTQGTRRTGLEPIELDASAERSGDEFDEERNGPRIPSIAASQLARTACPRTK